MGSTRSGKYQISLDSSILIFNDMINSNLRGGDEKKNLAIAKSGLIKNVVSCVEAARHINLPIFWIRVERRSDMKDVAPTLTEVTLAAGYRVPPPILANSHGAQNIAELTPEPDDHVLLKPRYDPFIGTDLDLQLRARDADTLMIGGYSTNVGVESCARTARDLGYNVIVLDNCCYNIDIEAHNFAINKGLKMFARVMTWQKAFELLAR